MLIAAAATAGLPLLVIAYLMFRLKLQFGVHALLLAVVVVAIPCGWVVRELERAHRRKSYSNTNPVRTDRIVRSSPAEKA